MRSNLLICTLIILIACTLALARQEQPTSKPVLIDVSDKAAVDAAMGKEVELEGVVRSAQWHPKGTVFFVNFEKTDESKVMAVAFEKKREALDQSFAGDVAKALTGARVRIRGKMSEYKGKPQVIIDMPSQITILETAPTTGPSTQPESEK
jgi:DNA/RNA endonuclease YhcR with UshA esterase domain